MAKRTVTRAAAAARKSPKARAAGAASKPVSTRERKTPTEAASADEGAAAGRGATSGREAKTAAAAKVQANKAAAKPAKARDAIEPKRAKAAGKSASTKSASTKPASTKSSPPRPRGSAAAAKKAKASRKTNVANKPKPPRFLATELGHPVDHEGEPIGAGSRAALDDAELQRYTLKLWQQMQSRRGVSTHGPAMERAGVTIDQIWTAGVTDRLTTSSTPDQMKRYRQKLLFRANLLESILIETVDELQRLGTIDPTPQAAERG